MSNPLASNEHARQQLNSLQPQPAVESKAGRIRQLLPDIEEAMRRGISQTEILNALANAGIQMTLDELRNALYRARRQLRKTAHETPQAPAKPSPKPAAPPRETPQQSGRQFNSTAEQWQHARDNPTDW
ncbi:hypothetical protein [Chromobacterium vaccinii]|uniref:hypothetical protein n=1 Tax=Chromobacterium vaccinii TaxID=1108595 RepID=UPI000617BBC3|nr:hypothetical protein [Chromobacterium vaccinii]